MATAQQIADAVLAEVQGEDLLIEAMCRARCAIHGEGTDSSDWEVWKDEAKAHLAWDRVLRGPGDKMAYERIVPKI